MEIFEYIYQDNYDPSAELRAWKEKDPKYLEFLKKTNQLKMKPFEYIFPDNYDPNAELRAWEEKDPKYLEFLKKTNQLKEA